MMWGGQIPLESVRERCKERRSHQHRPRGNGVMDSAPACHAGVRGSIPAVGVYSNGFFSPLGIGVKQIEPRYVEMVLSACSTK